MYYNKQGKKIDLMEWVKLFEDKEYKIIKQETLPNGNWISTVWVGSDHAFDGGTLLIFETMVFPEQGNYLDEDMERYSTEEEALAGHERLKEKYSSAPSGETINL